MLEIKESFIKDKLRSKGFILHRTYDGTYKIHENVGLQNIVAECNNFEDVIRFWELFK